MIRHSDPRQATSHIEDALVEEGLKNADLGPKADPTKAGVSTGLKMPINAALQLLVAFLGLWRFLKKEKEWRAGPKEGGNRV